MERIFKVYPAFDKRNSDPQKNYGIHGAEMLFMVKGEHGAIQFLLYTNWHLPHVEKEIDARSDREFPHLSCHPLPADIGYHSFVPRYDGQTVLRESCEHLDGKPCYYDGSSLNARKYYLTLIQDGSDALWASLEKYYQEYLAVAPPPETPSTEGKV